MLQSGLSARRLHRALCSAALAALTIPACEQRVVPPVESSTEWREFEGTWNAVGVRRTIPLGADRHSSVIDLRGTMLLTGPDRPGVGFRAQVIALVDSATGLVGRAVWTNEEGEEVYSELKGQGTRQDNHITGTFIGGTGRYSAVSGAYEFQWQFVIELEDGSIQGRADEFRGRYRLGAPQRQDAAP